jgi:acetyl esterase/lipase
LRFRIKQAFRLDNSARITQTSTIICEGDTSNHSASPPQSSGASLRDREKVAMKLSTGEDVEVSEQVHFYTVNSLLKHPLVSPVTGYLGGLPPLLFIAGDEEVLRDEIIYTLVPLHTSQG